ncbi:ankyrin repeat domain-containing protein [Candidatus Dependentiae bacterium]|nr:ankyrin repeat domain-containing protein [Candidatus Dependentiae bacterium]
MNFKKLFYFIFTASNIFAMNICKKVFDPEFVPFYPKKYPLFNIAAGYKGNAKKILKLIRKGHDVNAINRYGETALFIACNHDNKEIVEVLLENGAHPDIYSLNDVSPIHLACDKCDLEIVKLLIEANANLNIKICRDEITPLMVVCGYYNHSKFSKEEIRKEIVELLLTAGVQVNERNLQGLTALAIAKQNGYKKIVRILEINGAQE